MEPVTEDNSDNVTPWSGSEGSQELCASESIADSNYQDDGSDAEFPLDRPPPARTSADSYQPHDWEVAGDQRSLPEYSGSEGAASYREEDVYLGSSREFPTGSPSARTPPTSLSPHSACPDSGKRSRPHSRSSSCSLGCAAADMTLALTLDTDQPQRASYRQFSESLNREGDSSREGGSNQAPPVSVSFGILDEGAEQAEKWNSESDTLLCRPNSNRASYTRVSHNESQSEKQAKENKFKCKQIAQILTNAPNPLNKGAVLFKKRQQRVKKFTLVSYGTGESRVESEDQEEEETEEVRSAEYNLLATSESEFEEEYSVQQQQQQQQHHLSVNWGGIQEMEALPGTKGKGVFMFAQRRQRIDQIVSEQEELRNREIPAGTSPIPGQRGPQGIYNVENLYAHSDQGTYMNVNCGQQVECHESLQGVNQLPNVSKPTVPNRTAKPFLGFKNRAHVGSPAAVIQESKKHDLIFKVPVYAKTNPQVWSPTGDIIASRDERISVPAIKTGVLAESKRRVSSKQSAMPQAVHYQSKGERRSYIEPEEDGFSLGAEACNFMQPRTVKLKNPPPVAPKPTIDPSCPPWMRRSLSSEPVFPPRSPVSQPRQSPVGPHAQHYLQQQQDWTQPQHLANHWDLDQTPGAPQTTTNAWAPVKPSSQPPLLSTANSWNQHPLPAPVSMQACSPTYSPHCTAPPKGKPDSAPHSVASCPPEAGKSFGQPLKPSRASPQGRVAGRTEVGLTVGVKDTELFEKKLTHVGKFVAAVDTGNTNNAGAASPTLSLPNHWRYSPNVRAPPPISYNPIIAPFYPPSATKQLPSTSPKIKPKPKPVPKQLNTLDIMKHQPYHLDTSLFKYDAVPEVKSPSPRPTPASKFEATKKRKDRSAPSLPSDDVQTKAEVLAKSAERAGSQNLTTRGTTSDLTPAPSDVSNKQATPAIRPASTTSQRSSSGGSVTSAFSPQSLIARGARQMAPRPNFCAKKPVVMGPQWRPVTMLHSF